MAKLLARGNWPGSRRPRIRFIPDIGVRVEGNVDLGLQGKVAIVTGASKGIGLAITQALAAEGGRAIAGARDVAGDLESISARTSVTPIAVDLATPGGPQKMVDRAR